jgi:hypothetical protein
MFSAKHEFSGEWHRFLHPKDTDDKQVLRLELTPERFPFRFRGTTLEVKQVELFMKLRNETDEQKYRDGAELTIFVKAPTLTEYKSEILESDPSTFGGVLHTEKLISVSSEVTRSDDAWMFEARSHDIGGFDSDGTTPRPGGGLHADLRTSVKVGEKTLYHLKPDVIEDILVVCHYSVET